MRSLAERHGLVHLVAPVRPSWKERYPITPIEDYIGWRRADGELLDPWMRVHERLGARVGAPLPESLRITGTVAEWESWTGLTFPASGDYVFPEGLAPVHIDVDADLGGYWEPNVWMIHPRPSDASARESRCLAARVLARDARCRRGVVTAEHPGHDRQRRRAAAASPWRAWRCRANPPGGPPTAGTARSPGGRTEPRASR